MLEKDPKIRVLSFSFHSKHGAGRNVLQNLYGNRNLTCEVWIIKLSRGNRSIAWDHDWE